MEGRAGRVEGQVLQVLRGQGRTFTPREVRTLTAVSRGRQDLTQVLTGALWLLQGGQKPGGQGGGGRSGPGGNHGSRPEQKPGLSSF